MFPRPSIGSALVFSWLVGLAVLMAIAPVNVPEHATLTICVGAVVNAVWLFGLLLLYRFCRWLRRKQLEGDKQ